MCFIVFKHLKIYKTVLIYLLFLCAKICYANKIMDAKKSNYSKTENNSTDILKITEVGDGKTAVLSCTSNDQEHLFSFWQLADQDCVVGPGNKFDDFKYDYEILTGKLFIREVSNKEEGIYHCVSRGVRNNNINIRSVRMVVKKDWAQVDEHDPGVNYFRAVVVVGCLLIVAAIIYFVHRLRKKHRLQTLLDTSSDEEDSVEEIFRSPGTSSSAAEIGNVVIDSVADRADDTEGVPEVTVDFADVLNNRDNTQNMYESK